MNFKSIKYFIKNVLFFIGFYYGKLISIKINTNSIFFFPVYELGGAQKVHLDIVRLIKDKKPLIIFYNKSKNDFYLDEFKKTGVIIDLYSFLWPDLLRVFRLGRIAGAVSSLSAATVLGVGSPLYYKIVQYLDCKKIKIIDIIHAYNAIKYFPVKTAEKLYAQITIDNKTYRDLKQLYIEKGYENKTEQIKLINNKASIPLKYIRKNRAEKLRVIFVGRGTYEKRAYLIGRIATISVTKDIAEKFIVIGDVYESINDIDKKYCDFIGEIKDTLLLTEYYIKSDIIILTSTREGFPLVLMESMAFGVIPISTAVGGIPYHIKNEENGYLISSKKKEDKIIDEAVNYIKKLKDDRTLLDRLSRNCYNYAAENFSEDKFNKEYSKLLELG